VGDHREGEVLATGDRATPPPAAAPGWLAAPPWLLQAARTMARKPAASAAPSLRIRFIVQVLSVVGTSIASFSVAARAAVHSAFSSPPGRYSPHSGSAAWIFVLTCASLYLLVSSS